MKTLIVHREFQEAGGIGSLYKTLSKQFTQKIDHFECGSRTYESKRIPLYTFYRLLRDYLLFVIKITANRYDIIHINPTLDFKSTLRDAVFIILAKNRKRKVIVHFHGWFLWFEQKITGVYLHLFKYVFGKADLFIVLSRHKKNCLEKWGFKQPILLMANAFDVDLTKDLNINSLITKRLECKNPEILFLSRIIKEKGIFETVDALPRVLSQFPQTKLLVGGDGNGLKDMKEAAKNLNTNNIEFLGYVNAEYKPQVFSRVYAFILPSYAEGMPISIIEAMAFGLPVVATAVGGIPDFFENGRHGVLLENADPEKIADAIVFLLKDRNTYLQIAHHNFNYAQEHFISTVYSNQLENIYTHLYTGW